MSLLEELNILYSRHIKSLDPLCGLMNLRKLDCSDIDPETSLLPLASCTRLKELKCDKNAKDLVDLKKMIPGLRVYELVSYEQQGF